MGIKKLADAAIKLEKAFKEAQALEKVAKKAEKAKEQEESWASKKKVLEKKYGSLQDIPAEKTKLQKMRNTPEAVQKRVEKAKKILSEPVEPWTPPPAELQAFDRSIIKDALEGFPGIEQSRFPRDIPARTDISYVEDLFTDPVNRELIIQQIERGLPLGGETFYASLYPVKQAVLEAGGTADDFTRWVHELAPASARNSILNEMAVGQFLRDLNAKGIELSPENVTKAMKLFAKENKVGLPLMEVHRKGVEDVLGGINLREHSLANIPTNYKIPTYGTQKAGDFGKSIVLDTHESKGLTQASELHPYFTEQGGFGPNEYGAGEAGMLSIAEEMGIPGGMAQAGRWFGGGDITGLRSPRGDALDLLEKQVAYTLHQRGIQPNPANIREEVLRQIMTGEGTLLPWWKKEPLPDVRIKGLQRAEGGEVDKSALKGEIENYMSQEDLTTLLQELARRIQLSGEMSQSKEGTQAFGRLGYRQPIGDDMNVGIGASGHYFKGDRFKDADVDRADMLLSKRFKDESELRARLGANLNERMGKRGLDELMFEYEIPFKEGGSASLEDEFRRADIITSDPQYGSVSYYNDPVDPPRYAGGGHVNMEEEFRKADMFADGGWSSKYTKKPKMPEYDLLPSAKTVKQVGKILGKKAQEEYGEETAKPTLRAIPDVALNVGADIVGAPADIANIVTKRTPIQSKARPFGIYEQLKQESREGEPMFGSENLRKKLRETGIVERERPLIETAIETVLPFGSKLKGLPVGMSIKDVGQSFKEMAASGRLVPAKSKAQELDDLVSGKSKFAEMNLNWDDPATYDLADKLKAKGFKSTVKFVGPDQVTIFHKTDKDIAPLLKAHEANTPYAYGKAYGYSDNDIARFYTERYGDSAEAVMNADKKAIMPTKAEFVSSLEKAVNSHKNESMPGPQWSAWLNANASKSAKKEAEATGLYDWLKSQGKVSKADIEAYVEGNLPRITKLEKGAPLKLTPKDEIRLSELWRRHSDTTFYGGKDPLDYDEYNELMRLENIRDKKSPEDLLRQSQMFEESAKKAQAKGDKEAAESLWRRSEHFSNRAEALELNPLEVGGSRFEKWKEPGGEKYREVTLSIPRRHTPEYVYDVHGYSPKAGFKTREEAQAYVDEQNELIKELREKAKTVDPSVRDAMNRAIDNMENFPHQVIESELPISRSPDYQVPSAHAYGDPEADVNRILHYRANERLTPEGKKATFLEELQADWAQKGRELGFRQNAPKLTEDEERRFKELLDERRNLISSGNSDSVDKFDDEFKSLLAKRDAYAEDASRLPTGPYVTDTGDWTKLGLKHALKDAIEQGHDYLAWTTGEQQAKRYDLSKQVSEIAYHPKGKALEVFDIEGNNIINEEGINPEDLADYIGKEYAEKVLNSPEIDRGYNILKGDNLRVGGEGMKAYYDRMVPQYMRDILKQYGIKDDIKPIDVELFPAQRASQYDSPETTGRSPGDIVRPARYSTQMGIEITPELREKIMNEGLTHFKAGGSVDVVPFPRDN